MTRDGLSACGCRACGGSDRARDVMHARRVVAYAVILARKNGPNLANRTEPLDTYSRDLLTVARGWGQR